MVTAVWGCDNVEWGGIELAIIPPPPKAAAADAEIEGADRLPDGPIVYYVVRDSTRGVVMPVGEVSDTGLVPIRAAEDPETFGTRFIAAFLRQGAELTLFRNGRRAGTLIVDSASVPTVGVCRALPRAIGHLELSRAAGGATEFIAMSRTQAPEGRMLPGDTLAVDRRMQILGPMLAERALRARQAQLPAWSTALRQIQPFPISETQDLAFTATFLVDDELQVGNDTTGYSIYIVAVPQAQIGYDTALVRFVDYPTRGKSAPRTVDFLDWNRDGSVELLVEVYGTEKRWFEAIGRVNGEWRRIFEDTCDAPRPAAADTTTADTTVRIAPAPARADTTTRRRATTPTPAAAPPPLPEPQLRLQGGRRPARDTSRDTTSIRRP